MHGRFVLLRLSLAAFVYDCKNVVVTREIKIISKLFPKLVLHLMNIFQNTFIVAEIIIVK